MTKKYFLSGHGGWEPKDGYTTVPKGCTVVFYTDFAKCLMTGAEHQILAGTYNKVERTVEEFKLTPNMVLHPQPADWTQTARKKLALRNDKDCRLITVKRKASLEELFKILVGPNDTDIEFHWMACQALELNEVGGFASGVNAGDFAHDPSKPGRYRLDAPDGTQTWI